MFSKTPFVSAVKTRIAKDLGDAFACELFTLSALETLNQISLIGYDHIVAVADDPDDSFWSGIETISQLTGDLGERIDSVFSSLKKSYDIVYIIGADAFHINYVDLLDELERFSRSKQQHIIGRTYDGGFYLFGSKKNISSRVWNNITYSRSSTAEELISLIDERVVQLRLEFDLDNIDDLYSLVKLDKSKFNDNQLRIIDFVTSRLTP